jgi:membrane-associated phospholipid phosphatase
MKSLTPGDSLTIIFSAMLIALSLFFYSSIEAAPYLIILYSSIILFQLVLVRISGMNKVLSVFRDIVYPVICVLVIFDSLGPIVHRINPQDIDYKLIRLDYLLFGVYPTVYLERFISPLLTDVLQVAYSTYYFLAVTLGVAVRLKGSDYEFNKTVFLILLCFYLSYVGYILFPALGPRYAMEHLQTVELDGFMFSKTIQEVLNMIEGVKRDAFPSGHTAIALTVLYLAFRYVRKLGWIWLTPVILLVVATVYCRYHYVVDVIGGIILTIVTLAAGELYYKLREGRDHGTSP